VKKRRTSQDQLLEAFGQEIRKHRKVKGWSQERLAEECDLHRNYIGGIERGERNPSLKNIKKISDSLGIRMGRLFRSL